MTGIDRDKLTATHAKILENLSPSPVSIDELIRQCQSRAPLVLTVLLEPEHAGRIARPAIY